MSARPAVTAGVALATAGMIAATPVLPAAPEVNVPDIQLTAGDYGFSLTLQGWMQDFNSALVGGLLDANRGLVGAEVGLENLISPLFDFEFLGHLHDNFSEANILNGIVNRGFNVFNMGLGGAQSSLLGLLGANFTSGDSTSADGITSSLLVGLGGNNVFNSGEIGGLEGVFVQGLQAFANLTGFPGESMMKGLDGGLTSFNSDLVGFLTDFNGALKAGQLGLENMIFGSGSALNGVVNRGFDAFNMLLSAGQQGFLGLLGANFTAPDITSSLLLIPDTVGPFTDGTVGGLEGVLGNGYLVLADLIGGLLDPAAMFNNLNIFGLFNPWEILSGLLGF